MLCGHKLQVHRYYNINVAVLNVISPKPIQTGGGIFPPRREIASNNVSDVFNIEVKAAKLFDLT